jgi:predicted RNA-binding protein associated with RNAse of E/G family
MRTSIVTHDDELRARLQRLAWHASKHARTPKEAVQVDSLCDAVARGLVSKRHAYEALSALRGQQQAA